jgi:hypothetical protein
MAMRLDQLCDATRSWLAAGRHHAVAFVLAAQNDGPSREVRQPLPVNVRAHLKTSADRAIGSSRGQLLEAALFEVQQLFDEYDKLDLDDELLESLAAGLG